MKKKNEKGYLTVEATIVLSTFLFFMMFIMNFGHVYRVQNYMTHAALQTGKCLALSSFSYNQVSFGNQLELIGLMIFKPEKAKIELDWNNENYAGATTEMFQYCASGNPTNTQAQLDDFGVTSLDFSETTVVGDDLVLKMKYDIALPFAFFGYDKITMHQQVTCGLWK